jgi:hypothetical protein
MYGRIALVAALAAGFKRTHAVATVTGKIDGAKVSFTMPAP